MTQHRRFALVPLAGGALALLLAGCAGDGSTADPPPTPAATPAQTAAADGGAGTDGPAGGTMLAVSFPVGSAVAAVEAALPAGASLAALPPDIGWRTDRSVAVPVVRDGGVDVVVVVVGPPCTATSPLLAPDESAAVADAVCRAWEAEGRLPVVPADPGGGSATADPQDAAR